MEIVTQLYGTNVSENQMSFKLAQNLGLMSKLLVGPTGDPIFAFQFHVYTLQKISRMNELFTVEDNKLDVEIQRSLMFSPATFFSQRMCLHTGMLRVKVEPRVYIRG
jgi:hypothetical protein